MLAVTAALALLLAFSYHLAWPPVLVGILGTLPALYLAWLAVPRAISPPGSGTAGKPSYGRLAGRWDPVELGVHPAIGGGPMPAYVRRPHDELLRAVLDPAVAATRLVVVRGGSSTGKTRAAYEAVAARLADWRLDYPRNAAALAARLEAGIPARTVLWLGELRQYADDDDGAAVLGQLADLLEGAGHVLITTVWPEHWTAYAAAARAGPGAADPAGVAGRVLEPLPDLTGSDPARIDPGRGGVIDVPPRFTAANLEAATGTGDPVLAAAAVAAASAGQFGQVTQYLAGVPGLLERYAGRGGNPYGQAIITAAMDATRLGHASPLPAALIQEAAVGYLTGPQRTKDIASWRDTALTWAAEELRGTVQALQPVPYVSGTGIAGYQVADYLDHHGRRTRQDQLGPPPLWDALTAQAATASDLTRLGQAACDRGLYRHAAALWTTAAALGSAAAAGKLITHLRQVSPGETVRAARWAVSRAGLGNPWTVAMLLQALHEAGADDATQALAARAAAHVGVGDPKAVTTLLEELREAGAAEAAQTLAARAAAHVGLGDGLALAELLGVLREAGADRAAQALAARVVTHADLDDPGKVAILLWAVDVSGADGAAQNLAARAAAHTSLDDPGKVAMLLGELREARAWAWGGAQYRALAAKAVAHASLDHPYGIAKLLRALREAGADDAAQTLAARAAAQASLGDPRAIAELLRELSEAGASEAAQNLAARAAAHASLGDPRAIAELLRALGRAGADDAVTALLARDPAGHADLDHPEDVAMLLEELHEAGADGAARALAARAAAQAGLDHPYGVAGLLMELRRAGADDAVTALLARDPARYADLDHTYGIAELLGQLRDAGARDARQALAARAANAGMFDLFLHIYPAEASSYLFGREPDGAPSQPWRWEGPGQLGPWSANKTAGR